MLSLLGVIVAIFGLIILFSGSLFWGLILILVGVFIAGGGWAYR